MEKKKTIDIMEKEEINLIHEIKKDLERLGFPSKIENEEVIDYFLLKNVYAIFGKENFSSTEIDITKLVGWEENFTKIPYEKEKRNKLAILYGNINCEICTKEQGTILEMIDKNSLIGFNIYLKKGYIENRVTSILSGDIIQEKQTVYLEKGISFAYQKRIYQENGEEIYSPLYNAIPMGLRRGTKTVFCIREMKGENECFDTSQKKDTLLLAFRNAIESYFKDLGDSFETFSIPFATSTLGVNASLYDIFCALEKKTDTVALTRKYAKK